MCVQTFQIAAVLIRAELSKYNRHLQNTPHISQYMQMGDLTIVHD